MLRRHESAPGRKREDDPDKPGRNRNLKFMKNCEMRTHGREARGVGRGVKKSGGGPPHSKTLARGCFARSDSGAKMSPGVCAGLEVVTLKSA
jgi:hypothetical protein